MKKWIVGSFLWAVAICAPAWMFMMTASASAVTLLEPANNSITYMIHPHFRWVEDPLADRYDIQIATDSGFSAIQQSDSIPLSRYVPYNYLPDNDDYWWRVRAQYSDGSKGGWSATNKLTVLAGTAYHVYPTNSLTEITNKIALAAANTPSRLIFSPGNYALNLPSGRSLLALTSVKDMYIYGVSCNITMQNPDTVFANFMACKDIYVRGFTVDYATNSIPVTHTAGKVVAVDSGFASFEFEPLAGHLPPSDPRISNATSRRWGCLMNTNIPGRLKFNAPDFFDLEGTVTDLSNGTYRLHLTAEHASRISFFSAGDLFVKNAGYTGKHVLAAFYSTNITYALVTGNGSPGAFFGGNYNDGVHFLGCRSLIKPGRFVSTAADGVLGSGYKTGYWMEGCTMEGLLDDCVNAMAAHVHIKSKIDSTTLQLYDAAVLETGNHVRLFNPPEARVAGDYQVMSTIRGADGFWTTKLDKAVGTVYPGNTNSTSQLFIEERSHQYAYIRNNIFRNSRRYGALFGAHDAVIEGNDYIGLGSTAIHAENECNASFDPGFDTRDVRILNNYIEDCGQTYYFFTQNRAAIAFGINGYNGTSPVACTQTVHRNIEIAHNTIVDWDRIGILVKNAQNVLIYSNRITALNATSFYPGGSNYAVYLDCTSNTMVIGNDLLDARPLDAAVYAKRSTNCMVLDNVMDDTLVYTNGFDNPATFTGTVYYVAITNGRLISTSASVANANYRFKLAETPLTSDPSITEIRWQAVLKTPTNSEWIAVGFHGGDAALLSAGANSGPWVLFRSTSVTIQGGHSTTGSANTFGSLFTAGQVIHAEFAYHKPSKTADLYINGSPVAVGLPITHKNESGVVADPVIGYAQLMFRLQAPDGAYVDSFKAETLPVEIY